METEAVPGCAAGKCTIAVCDPGYADLNKDPTDGCEHKCQVYPTSVEICNGLDDDCDGIPDNGVVIPPNACNTKAGTPCAGATASCMGVQGIRCNYGAGVETDANGNVVSTETLCDGIDGNCNGAIDETWPNKGTACGVGTGNCQVTATFVCRTDKTSTICSKDGGVTAVVADPSKAVNELCDGIDNDCDGQIDERNPAGGVLCGGVACKGVIDTMAQIPATSVWIYSFEASHPAASSIDAGSLTNRACSVSGVLPWATVQEADAAAACAAVKDSTGASMRLCTQAEWLKACGAAAAWSYATAPATTYVSGECNDVNSGKNAAWPTGTGGPNCHSTETGGTASDLSGNVGEWTSTTLTVNAKTYYQVVGGNYGSQPLATECGYTFVIEPPTFSYADLGFRCCADHAP
jgi:hypothetical protein